MTSGPRQPGATEPAANLSRKVREALSASYSDFRRPSLVRTRRVAVRGTAVAVDLFFAGCSRASFLPIRNLARVHVSFFTLTLGHT